MATSSQRDQSNLVPHYMGRPQCIKGIMNYVLWLSTLDKENSLPLFHHDSHCSDNVAAQRTL